MRALVKRLNLVHVLVFMCFLACVAPIVWGLLDPSASELRVSVPSQARIPDRCSRIEVELIREMPAVREETTDKSQIARLLAVLRSCRGGIEHRCASRAMLRMYDDHGQKIATYSLLPGHEAAWFEYRRHGDAGVGRSTGIFRVDRGQIVDALGFLSDTTREKILQEFPTGAALK